MSRFKVLEYNEAFMAKLGIYSPGSMTATKSSFKSLTVAIIISIVVMGVSSSALCIYENWSDLELVLNALTTLVGPIQYGGILINLALNAGRIPILQGKLQEIVDEGKLSILNIFFYSNRYAVCSIHLQCGY